MTHSDITMMENIELAREMDSTFNIQDGFTYMDTSNDSFVNISPIRHYGATHDPNFEDSFSTQFSFSLRKLIANLFNPVTVTSAVLTVMRCEDQLDKIKSDNAVLTETVTQLKKENAVLTDSLSKVQSEKVALIDLLLQKDNDLSNMEIERLKLERELCETQSCYKESQQQMEVWESEKDLQSRLLCESQQHIMILEAQLEHIQETLDRTQNSLDQYMYKFQNSTERIALLENAVMSTQQELVNSNAKISHRKSECVSLQKDVSQLKHQLHCRSMTISENEAVITELTQKLCKTQECAVKGCDRIKQFESMVQQQHEQAEFLHQEALNRGEESRRYLSDLTTYRETHSYCNTLVSQHEETLHSLRYELEETRAELSLKNRQIKDFLRKPAFL